MAGFKLAHPVFIGLPARAKVVAGVNLLCTALMVVFMVQLVRPLLDDVRLADTGTLALQSNATARCSAAPVLYFCTIEANYVAAGTVRLQVLEMLTFWDRAGVGPFRVRYDPLAPDRIATSWGWSLRHNRARVLAAILVGFAVVQWSVRHRVAELWRAYRLRRVPMRPVSATVLDIRPLGGQLTFTLSWHDPAGVRREGRATLARNLAPLWADTARTEVLALAGAAGQLMLLDAGIKEVALADADRAALMAVLPG